MIKCKVSFPAGITNVRYPVSNYCVDLAVWTNVRYSPIIKYLRELLYVHTTVAVPDHESKRSSFTE